MKDEERWKPDKLDTAQMNIISCVLASSRSIKLGCALCAICQYNA